MKEKIVFIFLFLVCFSLEAQIENITTKYDLPNTVSETSGLLFYNGKLITHNDSGDNANLYELDTISGTITRTITITNATNIDWEDITQDDTHIYIGDFGNNNGNRQDLKIYRILKSDYNSSTSVTSEIITFSYEDQVNFSTNPYNHDFDAEAFSAYNNELIIFSKNWATSEVKAYSIPKTIGNHSAKNIGSYNSEGLITGSTYNSEDNSFLLCGYNKNGSLFLLFLQNIDITNPFDGVIERTDITTNIGLASQIEGIAYISGGKYFLSRENVNRNQLVLKQHLFRFDNGSFSTLSVDDFVFNKVIIYPNPSKELIQVTGIAIEQIFIIDTQGRKVFTQKNSSNQIRIHKLTAGTYFLKIASKNNTIITKKFIKN
jgi:hypothetical protein